MKKLNAIFIILISFLLFTVKFEDFNRVYATNINVPFFNYVMNHKHSNEVNLYIDINSVEEDKDKLILDFVEKIDFPSGILQREDSISNNYILVQWFIHGNVNKLFSGLYGLDTITNIDDNEDYFITNDKEDERNTHLIRYLDNKYYNFSSSYFSKLEISPMEKLSNVDDSLLIVFLVEDNELDLFHNRVDLALNDKLRISDTQITNHDFYSQGNFSHGLSYYFKLPKPILYISTVTLIVLLYLETKANHKEITIRSL